MTWSDHPCGSHRKPLPVIVPGSDQRIGVDRAATRGSTVLNAAAIRGQTGPLAGVGRGLVAGTALARPCGFAAGITDTHLERIIAKGKWPKSGSGSIPSQVR